MVLAPLFVFTELELEGVVLDDVVDDEVPVMLIFTELELEVVLALLLLLLLLLLVLALVLALVLVLLVLALALVLVLLVVPTAVIPALMTRGLYI